MQSIRVEQKVSGPAGMNILAADSIAGFPVIYLDGRVAEKVETCVGTQSAGALRDALPRSY